MKTLVFCIEAVLLVVTLAVVSSGGPAPSNLALPGGPVAANLALNKLTWQSSTFDHSSNPYSGKAVDGDRSSNFAYCACTEHDRSPWWTVDLGIEYEVAKVVITNRGDCCAQRLSNFTVAVGNEFNSENFDPRSFQECIHVPGQLDEGETRILECRENIEARYVTVYLNNRNYLTLCEVEVYKVRRPAPTNLALHRWTWQSSTYHHGHIPTSSKAVDGDSSTDYAFKSCTATNEETNPWWVVDLAEEYPVTEVVITNRGDCCPERLSDFSVSVGNTFDPANFDPYSFTKCVYVPGQLANGETRALECHQPTVGRYVTVFLNHMGILTLCEVKVHRSHQSGLL